MSEAGAAVGASRKKKPSGAHYRKRRQCPDNLAAKAGETDLEAMIWVLENRTDESVKQWQMRQSLLKDREKFLDRKLVLEKLAGPALTPSSGPSPAVGEATTATGGNAAAPPDLGTEACLRLIEELLEKHGVKP